MPRRDADDDFRFGRRFATAADLLQHDLPHNMFNGRSINVGCCNHVQNDLTGASSYCSLGWLDPLAPAGGVSGNASATMTATPAVSIRVRHSPLISASTTRRSMSPSGQRWAKLL